MVFFSGQKVYALQSQTPLKTVLSNTSDRTVPAGLSGIKQWFNVPALSNNNAEVWGPSEGDNKSNSDVIVLTKLSESNKVGAIWSDRTQAIEDNQNYIDINKKQTMSMWLYFGGNSKYSANQITDPGDGMAFVLQNAGPKALAQTPSGSQNIGEALGVWGETNNVNDTATVIAQRAIQNSWALEFDTFANMNGQGIDSNFDKDLSSGVGHLAYNYPGLASTYRQSSGGAIMNHKWSAINYLTDDKWHHLTMTWTPASETGSKPQISFEFNDKNMDGSATDNAISSKSDIDIENFQLNGSNKLYWGFTGSTGASTENNLVIFESIPAMVEAEASSTITDESAGGFTLTDPKKSNDTNSNVVHVGDKLNVNYDLKYLSGSQAWQDIEAKIKLPSHVSYSCATITYTDVDGNKKNEDLTEFSTMSGNALVHKLAEKLFKTGINSAQIRFTGTVDAGAASVASEHSGFYGSNLKKDVMTTAFEVKESNKILLQKISSDPKLTIDGTTGVEFKVANSDLSTIDPSQIMIHAVVNGTDIFEGTMDSMLKANSTDTFILPVSQEVFSSLHKDDNPITIYAYNTKDHNNSDPINFVITVTGGELVFTATRTSHFNSVQSYSSDELIGRAKDWDLLVSDGRQAGSTWKLSAQASPMVNGNNKWTDNDTSEGIVYVDKSGKESNITNTDTKIAEGTKDSQDTDNFDIDAGWTNNSGILLRRKSYEMAGTYTSTITWTIADAI